MNNSLEVVVDELFSELFGLIKEKSEALNTLNIAVNEYVRLKNEYMVKSNELRLKPDVIKEELGLGKPATEKQQQAYIDDVLKDLRRDLRIADENVASWKREVDLLNEKIVVERDRVQILSKGVNK